MEETTQEIGMSLVVQDGHDDDDDDRNGKRRLGPTVGSQIAK